VNQIRGKRCETCNERQPDTVFYHCAAYRSIVVVGQFGRLTFVKGGSNIAAVTPLSNAYLFSMLDSVCDNLVVLSSWLSALVLDQMT
jgi:hypothetical protein